MAVVGGAAAAGLDASLGADEEEEEEEVEEEEEDEEDSCAGGDPSGAGSRGWSIAGTSVRKALPYSPRWTWYCARFATRQPSIARCAASASSEAEDDVVVDDCPSAARRPRAGSHWVLEGGKPSLALKRRSKRDMAPMSFTSCTKRAVEAAVQPCLLVISVLLILINHDHRRRVVITKFEVHALYLSTRF